MILVLARLTLLRVLRGRAVWVSAAIAGFPILFAFVARDRAADLADQLLVFEQFLLAILPAMFVASSIGEEIEDRTMTYLWSRPLARGAVLAGKLAALIPLVIALSLACWIGSLAAGGAPITARSMAGIAIGAAAISIIAAGMALLVPRQGMALTICYLLFFDLPIGYLPASLRALSVSFHTRVLCGAEAGSVATSLGELGALVAIWGAIAIWRLRRLEA